MSNNPSPKKPGWKQGGGPEKAPAGPVRGWKKEQGTVGAPVGATRKLKLLGSLTGFFVLLALLFWLIWWIIQPKKTALILVAAGYETNLTLPQNAAGRHATDALRELAEKGDPGNNKNFLAYNSGGDFKHKADWEPPQKLSNLEENVLLLVFSVHGISDGKSNYLLRDGGSPWNMKEHLSLDEVLTVLEGVSTSKKKVLVLDVVHSLSHGPTGQIHNDFVPNLKALDKRIKEIPNLVVLCSTDDHQRSWYSPEWGRSVYLHYLLEGLKGAADQDKHGEIKAWELHQFLASRTKRWVFDNRATLQTPILLPLGEEGQQRASGINVAPTVAYRDPEKPATFALKTDGLQSAWAKWAALRNNQPAPWTYAPHVWRLYCQAMLRYEELLLVGSSFAGAARTEADKFHDSLSSQRAISLDAQGFALPLAAVGGIATPQSLRDKVKDTAGRLQRDDTPKTWSDIRKETPPADLPLLVQELQRYFLKDFVNKARDLRTAPFMDVMERIKTSGVRPIEVHFARMLALASQFSDKDSDEKSGLLLEALGYRIRAEEIALAFDAGTRHFPYAEQIRPWLEGRLALADETRRHAEDWLFANRWETATGDYLNKVEGQYAALEADVKRLRQALALRDRALAELPGLSYWIAARDSADGAKSNEQMTQSVTLWETLHDLDQALSEAPHPNPQALNDQITRIDTLAGDVRKGLDKITQEYVQQVNGLLQEKETPNRLHALLALAEAPLLDADKRTAMARKIHEMSGNLLRSTETSDTNDTKIESSAAASEFQPQVERRVARYGRLLLARVGKYNMPAEYAQSTRIGMATKTVFDEASHVGRSIRTVLQRLGDDSDTLLKGLPSRNLDGCREDLLKAEKLGRHLSVASAPLFVKADYNPGVLARHLRLYDLLIWQTRRTQQDFWNWETKQANPYYVDAGKRCLDDARKRLSELPSLTTEIKESRLAQIQQLENLLESKPKLAIDGLPAPRAPDNKPTLHITSELEYDLDFRLKVHKDVPRGYPYTTFVIKESDLLTQNVQEQRRVAKVEKDTDLLPLQLRLNNELLAKQSANNVANPQPRRTTEVRLSSWFRGHVDDPTINVIMYPFANNVHADEPPSSGAAVSVYGKGLKRFSPNNSGLVIVVDCSGSMKRSPVVNGKNRFERVKEALEELLRSIEDDTQVSLWIYGQRTAPGYSARAGGDDADAESTIFRMISPRKWKKAMTSEIMSNFKDVDADLFTPLARSLIEARKDLAPWENGDKDGFATLVVLTDGKDTCFQTPDPALAPRTYGDPRFNRDRSLSIADFLTRELERSNCLYRIIGYDLSPAEQRDAEAQFGALRTKLRDKFTLDFTDNLDHLKRLLRERSQQKLRYTIRDTLTESIRKEGILPEIRPVPTPLEPGSYKVLIHGPRTITQRVRLENGDSLSLRVAEDGNELRVVRDAMTEEFSDRPQPTELRREGEHWNLTNLRNKRITAPPGQSILLTLNRIDQAPRGANDELTVMAPGFVWMELKGAQDEKTPLRLKWGRAQSMPAPTWDLDAIWPTAADLDSPTRLMLWVSTSRPQAVPGSLEKGIHWNLGAMGDPAPRAKEWDRFFDGKVKIESVRRETHLIKFGPEQRPERRECLVVRASYEGEPVFVEPQGFPQPALHHYYTDARKYTGYFMLTKGQSESVNRFNLYSLEEFKRHGQTLNGTMKLDKPRADDNEPVEFRRVRPQGAGS